MKFAVHFVGTHVPDALPSRPRAASPRRRREAPGRLVGGNGEGLAFSAREVRDRGSNTTTYHSKAWGGDKSFSVLTAIFRRYLCSAFCFLPSASKKEAGVAAPRDPCACERQQGRRDGRCLSWQCVKGVLSSRVAKFVIF